MKNKLMLFYCVAVLLAGRAFSQSVAINNDGSIPHASSILDIKSANKGLLIPRTSTTSRSAISNPAKGLMIFDTTTSSCWFYDGSTWVETATTYNTWSMAGNTGTDPSTHFLGTIDNQPLKLRLNDTWAGELNRATGNYSIGSNAGLNASGGYSNVAIGNYTLQENISGNSNVAIGESALNYNYSSGMTAVGAYALLANSNGTANTALGYASLPSNSVGTDNTAAGYQTLYFNTTGSRNVALGADALRNNVFGNNNTAVGTLALASNFNGANNIALGADAGTVTGTFINTISIGNYNYQNAANNQAFFGNLSILWNGGNVGWSTFSDARIKKNISEEVKGLEFIMRLRPVTYYRDIRQMMSLTGNKISNEFPEQYEIEKIKFSGFLAQEVEQAAKESSYDFNGVKKPADDKDVYTLSYETFVVPLVKAVQEQQVIIQSLREKISVLEKKIQQQ